jgi:eukaryotic-like serine/threonine-protein kinase
MPSSAADRNVLFGLLALQLDFVGRDAVVQAVRAWVQNKARTLGQVLREQGTLRDDEVALLEALVQKHLEKHGNDVTHSLTAVSALGAVREELQQITDPDVQATVAPALAQMDISTRVPVTNPVPTAPPSAAAGTGAPGSLPPFGPRFRVIRPHAKGGLGQVLLAHDAELQREVALKEIQAHYADDRDSRARFLFEAQITGRLEHPGIVPVYGMGTYADGRPYYAMRFIKGDSLQDAVRQFHQKEGPGRDPGERALALRELLGRFVDVCNAVAYAHSRGVLHRDLKPGNVMLGKYGETLVVDWGLAKVLDRPEESAGGAGAAAGPFSGGETAPTLMGQAIGTPAFMSPEQAAGRPDLLGPASDVYSLGATLYALLTGRPPFDARPVGVLLHQVQKGEFPPPRQVNPRVPAALEAVCLKAMALRPEDRYRSAQGLADDVEHWLADEPVSVYREPLVARAARWARHHRTLVAGTAVLLVTALVALAVTAVLVSREQARTAEQRRLAETNFQTALQAVDDMLTEVAQEQLAPEPRMEKKRRALLARARTYYEQFLQQRGDDPGLRAEAARAHKRLGDIARLLGEHGPARESYDQAIALLTRLEAEHPADPAYRYELGVCYDDLGEVERRTSHPEQAREAYRRSQELLAQLVAETPDRPEYRKELARTQDNLGIFLADTQRSKEAEEAWGRALDLFEKLAAEHPKNLGYRQHLARALLNLGPLLRATGRPEKAEEAYRRAIRLQTELVDQDHSTPDYRYELGVSYNNLGYLLLSTHREAEAEDAFRQALARYTRLVLDFPDVPVYRKELALTQNNLAIVLARARKWPAAEEAWGRALDLFEKLAAEHPEVPDYEGYRGMALGNLGWLLLRQRDQSEVAAGALAVGASAPGAGPWPAEPALVAGLARRTELLTEACRRLEKARDLTQVALKPNPDNPSFRQALCNQSEHLAETRLALGEHAEAARVAAELPGIFPTRGPDCVLAAGLLARCIALAENDPRLPPDRRQALSTRYADQAMEILRQGVARGYRDAERLTRPPFTALQQRADFQGLLGELKAGPHPEPR